MRYVDTPIRIYRIVQTTGKIHGGGDNEGFVTSEYLSNPLFTISDAIPPIANGIAMLINSDFHLIFDVTVKKPHPSVYLYSKMWFLFL